MAKGKGARSLILIVMDVLFVVVVIQVARLVVMFFGDLAASQVGAKVIELTDFFVLPLGIVPTGTAFGGVFDWNTAVSIGIVLLAEGLLSLIRRRA